MSESTTRRPVTHEEIADRLDKVEERLSDGSGEFAAIKGELEAIRADAAQRSDTLSALATNVAAVRELVELMAVAKKAGRFAAFIGRMFGWMFERLVSLIKWGGAIAAALAAFFMLIREWVNFINPKG